ncbi:MULTISPECIES: hypothetical protein [Vibrio]|uniref:hypothetical protein n=1 Tax=Vibrio TaxID=662 RepID=UPI0003000495|nr:MULTISPECIES: hypothetical protein [Vibrio]MBE8606176.1 hypothetical protein [Vibrio sp. OPT10]PME42562.1 hypothetical protein BCV36_13815 [Vibrio cyclitrophicus]PME56464.1 hypothetical protein BCV37_22415 [Vibrio cyclitrophicus]PMF42438.1 hypothetical protein BCV15_13655 [Vibrio cyclitrophicus]
MFEINNLNDEDLYDYCWGGIADKYDVSAKKYLEYACEDLSDGHSSRHLINSLSNAKRALHIRMEEVSNGFGGKKHCSNKFPSMLNYLRSCGIVTPRTLERINTLRNKVEHDYSTPELMDVNTYIDIIELFIESTRKWMERRVDQIIIGNNVLDSSGKYELKLICFNWEDGEIKLSFNSIASNDMKEYIIAYGHEDYFPLIFMVLKNDC